VCARMTAKPRRTIWATMMIYPRGQGYIYLSIYLCIYICVLQVRDITNLYIFFFSKSVVHMHMPCWGWIEYMY